MKDKKKYVLSVGLMALVIAITFYVLLKDNQIKTILPALKQVDLRFIGLGVLVMSLFPCCEAANIHAMLRSFGQKASYLSCVKYAYVGFYFSSITPSASGGQPVQMYFMSKDNISVSYSSLTFLVIAGVYQVVMIGYAGLMFLLRGAMIAQNLKGIVILLVCGIIIGIGIISALVLAVFSNRVVKAVMGCLLKIAHKLHIVKNLEGAQAKVDAFVHDYKVGAAHIRKNPLVLLKMLAYTALQLTVLFSIPFFVYRSFGLSSFSMLDVIAMQAILTLSVSALPLPGAVGLSEGGFMIMFRLFFAPGILLPAMMLSRGISFYLFVAISGVVSLAAYLKLRTKQKGAKRHGQLVSAGQCRKAVCGSCERVEHVDL